MSLNFISRQFCPTLAVQIIDVFFQHGSLFDIDVEEYDRNHYNQEI